MKPSLILIVTAGVLFLAGCSTPTKVDTGKIRARSFSFVERISKPPAYADNRQVVHTMIQEAVTRNLAGKGLSRMDRGGDITVAYLVIVGNNATTTSINDYFGYRTEASRLADKAHEAYTGSKNPNYFEAGTLVIDLVDSKTFKVLKRGHATRPIMRELPSDARAARIQEVVDEILRNVRFTP